jgi:hypothetical protein
MSYSPAKIMHAPVPKLSSPQIEHNPASMRFPKNFHPVGTYLKNCRTFLI